jgi:Fusaric acid resistance protein-like
VDTASTQGEIPRSYGSRSPHPAQDHSHKYSRLTVHEQARSETGWSYGTDTKTRRQISCFISYAAITQILTRAYFVSRDDDFLGGMWAVAATVFVYRESYQKSVGAALSRMAATSLSFVLCLVYLLILPFHAWGMAALIGIGTIALSLLGRSEDIITAGITTAVVMVVAGISPQHAWKQPLLRLVDTLVGVGVGIVAAWISLTIGSKVNLQRSRA